MNREPLRQQEGQCCCVLQQLCGLCCFLLPQGTAAMGPEQLSSFVSAGSVLLLCLLQGGGLVVEMRCRALHSSGHQVLHLVSARTFCSGWEGG